MLYQLNGGGALFGFNRFWMKPRSVESNEGILVASCYRCYIFLDDFLMSANFNIFQACQLCMVMSVYHFVSFSDVLSFISDAARIKGGVLQTM